MGRLRLHHMTDVARFIDQSVPHFVRVYRSEGGAEVLKVALNTHIAATDKQVEGRDIQLVEGGTSPQLNVMHVPPGTDIVLDDEVWRESDSQRFRVVAVDPYLHQWQVLLRQLQ